MKPARTPKGYYGNKPIKEGEGPEAWSSRLSR